MDLEQFRAIRTLNIRTTQHYTHVDRDHLDLHKRFIRGDSRLFKSTMQLQSPVRQVSLAIPL